MAGFYASEARELNNHIKAKQREAQMHLFLAANQGTPGNSLDLHYLQVYRHQPAILPLPSLSLP